MRTRIAVALTALVSAGVATMVAAPASAHTSLIDVQPTEGDTVQEGTVVSLTFSDDLLDLGTEMIVTDADGDAVALEVERPDPATVAATLPVMEGGPVTVSWRVVAADGHPIEGTLSYVAEAVAASETAPSLAPATASPSASDAATASATSPAAPDQGEPSESGGLNWTVWIAVAAAIFAAAAVATAAKRRR
ncbi:copper resistance CopC family protein [Demequina sp.]|uniref:copper resistance CopC family protein n=1 Tax=Demequina sp. TaxID=2050685 RepID=UPI0025BED6C2|nr:copper resistance CopC family protein [Demequina sp.]